MGDAAPHRLVHADADAVLRLPVLVPDLHVPLLHQLQSLEHLFVDHVSGISVVVGPRPDPLDRVHIGGDLPLELHLIGVPVTDD